MTIETKLISQKHVGRAVTNLTMAFLVMLTVCFAPVRPALAEGVIKIAATAKTRSISVAVAKPTTFRTDAPFAEIVVGDPEMAIVTPLTDQSFYIVGSKPGITGIALFSESKELIGSLDIEIGPNARQINEDLRNALGNSGIKAKTSNGGVILSGKAKSPVAAEKARKIAKKFDLNAVDTIEVESSVQVQLEVRFIEAQRKKTKELGVAIRGNKGRLAGSTGNYNTAGNWLGASLISGNLPFGQIITRLIEQGLNIDLMINALEQKGVARRLAEPTLVALSGDKASFLAGGEFPVPVAADDGRVSVEFKKFGVGLNFTPTVLSKGMIHLSIAPEVSAIDYTSSVKFNNVEIPGLIVRRASTTLELRDGQSFVLAGLLNTEGGYDVRKFPWLGDIPILGPLFRSTSYRKKETDLVIIVTPRLVKPLAPGAKIASPLDSTLPPNEADLFLNGKTEVSRAQLRLSAHKNAGILSSGHILDF